ncbi:MAG: family 16 glycosylhydrolase [Acutalibacteraceae bacterium]|nr:family 16 glycosylhydrolase [Acutalibacteraceae bacterium]
MKKLLCFLLCFVMLMGSTVSIIAQGGKDDTEIDIGDILGVSTVTFNKGAESWCEVYDKGSDISYPSVTASRITDNYWSMSDSSLVAVPKTAVNTHYSVYYYENPVISFENYYNDYYAGKSMVVQPSSDFAYSGNKSAKISNTHFAIPTKQPDNWSDKYNDYYHLVDGIFVKNNFDSAPDYTSQQFYQIRNGQREHSIVLGKTETSTTYKLTFKYYIEKALTTPITLIAYTGHSNLWGDGDSENGKRVVYDESKITFDSSIQTGVWHTGVMYFTTSPYTINDYKNLYIFVNVDNANTYDYFYIDDVSYSVVELDAPTITYHYNNGIDSDLVITEGVTAGMELAFDSIPTAPEGKYFAGWYSDAELTKPITSIKVPTVPVNDSMEAHAYAKWGDYAESYDKNYEGYVNTTTHGYGYMLDDEYRNSVTEGGWATVKYTDEGILFTKNAYSGQAVHFNPDKTDGTEQYVGKGYITDSAFKEDSHEIGQVVNLGWGVNSSLTLKDKNGNMLIAKPNTTYTAVITYKVTKEGSSSFLLSAGRPYDYVDRGADDIHIQSYANYWSSAVTNGEKKVTGEYLTAMTTLITEDFTDSVPVLSIYGTIEGYRAERVACDDNGVTHYTYTKDGQEYTVYPYKPLSVPEFVIKEITLIEVEEGKSAVVYNYYSDGEGFTAELQKENIGSALTPPETDSVDNYWYTDVAAYDRYEAKVYPSDITMLYNANYLISHVNENPGGYAAYVYSGAKGLLSAEVEKNGEMVNALRYNPYGYDEYVNLYGKDYADKDDIVSTEAEKVERMNSAVSKGTNMFRLGSVEDGHTYKVSFFYKAVDMNTDLTLRFKTAHKNNIYMYGSEITQYTIAKGEGDWKKAEFYITADLGGMVDDIAGGDDIVLSDGYKELYVSFIQNITKSNLSGEDNDIYFTDFTLTDLGTVIGTDGASILTEEAATTSKNQALRYYFNYETVDGSTIILDGKTFNIIERGFIYKNGAIDKYTNNSIYLGGMTLGSQGTVSEKKTDNFNYCWEYEYSLMTFSTYVNGFDSSMADYDLIVRGYITFADEQGIEHTIYSDTINRSISYVDNGGGSTIDPNRRYLVWSAGIEQSDNVKYLNDLHQDTNASSGEGAYATYNIVKGGDNWIIEDGAMILRIKESEDFSESNLHYDMAKCVNSKNQMSFKYGYLEMDAQVPFAYGSWPAFWLRPQYEFDSSKYPADVKSKLEVDIFEVFGLSRKTIAGYEYGNPTTAVVPQLHKWYSLDEGGSTSVQLAYGTVDDAKKLFMKGSQGQSYTSFGTNLDSARSRHRYGFEWTPEYMAFYIDAQVVDGVPVSEPYYKIRIDGSADFYNDNPNSKGMECFHQEAYVCFSHGVMVSYAGVSGQAKNHSDTNNIFKENGMETIDYKIYSCKLYQYKDGVETVDYH